jgi:V/A-type H+-transporting ATPase subunit K
MKTVNIKLILWLAGIAFISIFATLMLWWSPAIASDAAQDKSAISTAVTQYGYLAAALATGLSSLAAGYAVAHVGSAAIGALTEKPEILGRILIIIGLAEGIAIYGLIISILILNAII